jgi:hypothetical protein
MGLPQPECQAAPEVGARVQAIIDREGAFITYGDLAAFVCR